MPFGEKVSDEELELDISTTEAEVEAYKKLVEGFNILAGLRDQPDPRSMNTQVARWSVCQSRCQEFLDELKKLREERRSA